MVKLMGFYYIIFIIMFKEVFIMTKQVIFAIVKEAIIN